MGAAGQSTIVDGLDVPADEYNKLYKKLGTKNNNKDVRQQVQQRLKGTLEAEVSPNFQINVNPGYQFDNGMADSTNRMTLKGEKT